MVMGMQEYLRLPGPEAVLDTFEQAFIWNKGGLTIFDMGSIIASTATDSGNTPTTTLRGGLLLGRQTSSGQLVAYSATASDGSQYVYSICPFDVNMLDINAVAQIRTVGTVIGGYVKASQLYGLDNNARNQMRYRFTFDDDFFIPGAKYDPWGAQVSKTANYTILSTDNGTLFDNTGAAGAVTFTLPAIANGYNFGFVAIANQNLLVTSNEGTNVVVFNNASASTVSYQTAGQIIGGIFRIYTNAAGTKWIVETPCKNAVTIA